jgi:hypothetical protein
MSPEDQSALMELYANPASYLSEQAFARLKAIIECTNPDEALYFIGSGQDFDQMALPVILEFEHRLSGVSCVWTKVARHGTPSGMRLFDLRWSYVEPPVTDAPVAVLCQTILADEMEAVVAAATIWDRVKPSKILVLTEFANRAVIRNLGIMARANSIELVALASRVVDISLRNVRSDIEAALDTRDVKSAPLLSRWLATRAIGPDPRPQNRASLQRRSGRFG